MIYGNKFLPKEDISIESASILEFGIQSVVYDEYCVYNSLLESCSDDTSKSILEAQVQVLYEVSIKDIFNKIITKIKEFIEWIKKLASTIVTKIKNIVNGKKMNKYIQILKSVGKGKLSKSNESTIIDEDYKDDPVNRSSYDSSSLKFNLEFFKVCIWTIGGDKNSSASFNSNKFKSGISASIEDLRNLINEFESKFIETIKTGKYDKESFEKYDSLEENINSIKKQIESLNYDAINEQNKYDSLYNAIEESKEIFDKPSKYESLFAQFCDHIATEIEILGKVITSYANDMESFEKISVSKKSDLAKFLSSSSKVDGVEFGLQDASFLASRTIKYSKNIAIIYHDIISKLSQAQNKMEAKASKLCRFMYKYRKDLEYIPEIMFPKLFEN